MSAIVPVARCAVTVRPAVAGDYPFIDRLQDMHSKALGFMPKAQLEGKIAAGNILIAEETKGLGLGLGLRLGEGSSPNPNPNLNHNPPSNRIGYCMSQDRYFKRDDVGIIYQMNVSPGAQRKLVGAMLLKAVFERAAYGCRLFCCWCAQDLDANYFWESLGFIPLAFRMGASGRSARGQLRTHIFWQRRIREGDVTTPYWFPSKTDGGMMREDRLVLPIPPGVHWKDAMPNLLPSGTGLQPVLEDGRHGLKTRATEKKVPTLMPPTRRGARFGPPSAKAEPAPVAEKPKPQKTKREKVKADPKHVAAARELRDRWLERVNAPEGASVLLSGGAVSGGAGKYDVSKTLAAPPVKEIPQLPHSVAA